MEHGVELVEKLSDTTIWLRGTGEMLTSRTKAEHVVREILRDLGLDAAAADRAAAAAMAALWDEGFFVGHIELAHVHPCHGEPCDNPAFVDPTDPLYRVVEPDID